MSAKTLASLVGQLTRNPGAPMERLVELQATLGCAFPPDYVQFMAESDGAEGSVGRSYLALWTSNEITSLSQAACVGKFAPGLVLFGADGGDTAYAFDTRSAVTNIVDVPLVGMSLEQARPCGATFGEFIEHLATKQ